MRIGITTYWQSADNYGQQLQGWALQQYLLKQGHDPFLIRFMRYEAPAPVVIEKRKSVGKKISQCLLRIIGMILVFPYLADRKKRKAIKREIKRKEEESLYYAKRNKERAFEEFRKNFIISSDRDYPDLESLRNNPPVADAYITGSDQVWNYDLQPDELAAFFLQFGNRQTRRISYAPSIGHTSWQESQKGTLKYYLSSFDAISVREHTGAVICKEIGFDATHVLDPTLLLHAEDYMSICNERPTSRPYIFVYSMNYKSSEDLPWEALCHYAKQQALDIRVTPGSGYFPCREIFEYVEYSYATIPEWLTNIKYADLVVTASFHGIIFAILLHRPFVFTPLKGTHSVSNTRVLDLLNILGLSGQICNTADNLHSILNNDIDWDAVEQKLSEQRSISQSFLYNNLKP